MSSLLFLSIFLSFSLSLWVRLFMRKKLPMSRQEELLFFSSSFSSTSSSSAYAEKERDVERREREREKACFLLSFFPYYISLLKRGEIEMWVCVCAEKERRERKLLLPLFFFIFCPACLLWLSCYVWLTDWLQEEGERGRTTVIWLQWNEQQQWER